MQVLVLGAGIAGLTSALELARAGHDVGLFARQHTPETTSDVAAAFHYPFLAGPREKAIEWGEESLRTWGELAGIEGSGVRWDDVLEILDAPADDPWWAEMVETVDPAPEAILPERAKHGLVARVPVIDMRDTMPWLRARAEQAGVAIEEGEVPDLAAVGGPWEAIVNCTGLGARELVGDDEMFPVRGQVAYATDPGLERILLDRRDEDELAYVVPFGDRVVLGGTVEKGVGEATTDEATIEAIVERCRALEPRLEDAEVLGSDAGIRPYRPEVRLEREQLTPSTTVVHNYGHGGAGVTLAWGCAREVAGCL